MNHERAQLLMHGYLDAELDLVNSLELEEHLRGCDVCSHEYRNHLALRTALVENDLYVRAPARLTRQVRSSIRRGGRSGVRSLATGRLWLLPAAGLAIVAIVALVLLRPATGTPSDNPVADQVLAGHLRSLMVAHLTDVTSTDQHTVKPWFDGKLDFSPVVNNFSDEGFPLIGGRLDYIGERAVAALVYQRRLHVINLFVWPSSGGDSGPQIVTRQGYQLIQWNQGEMAYWAVSDLSLDELQQFVQLVRHPPGP